MKKVSFPPVEVEVWQRQVQTELRGRPLRKLDRVLPGGLRIQTLYTSRPEAAVPAGSPGWERCQKHSGDDPEVATHIATDLSGGAASIWLEVGSATQSVADLRAALAGVKRLRLDAGGQTLAAAAVLLAAELPLEPDGVRLGMDPLGALASGTLQASLPVSFSQAAALVTALQSRLPGARALGINTTPYHLAGASPQQELGIAAAALVDMLRALEAEGLAPEDVATSLEWSIPMGRDVFVNVARVRALRTLHAAVLSACGVTGVPAQIHAASSTATLTARDPWVNLLRVTTHGYAAVLGGADSITTATYDSSQSELGRRIARNTQIILDEECQLGHVIDPTRGSYYVESLTSELVTAAWGQLQSIEARGGLGAVLLDGSLATDIAESGRQLQSALRRRKQPITGVSEFPILSQPAPSAPPHVGGQDVEPYAGPTDLKALIIAAAGGASVSALADAVKGAAPATPALPQIHEAAEFEVLRDRVDAWIAAGNSRPRAFLANLGHRAAWTPRATFVANLLAAGGIDVAEDPGTGDDAPGPAAAQLKARADGATVVVICGTDAAYESHGPALITALPGYCALAGRTSLDGINRHIHLGCDAVEILTELLDVMGVTR